MSKLTGYNMDWLKQKVSNEESLKYIFFWGHTDRKEGASKACMSQWYESPFTVDGILYKTAEHWMMAKKAELFNDKEILEKIIACNKPGEAKALGREVRNYADESWLANRFNIVVQGSYHKFSQHPPLKEFLINTGDRVLVEASPLDKIWGIGMAQDHKKIDDVNAWRGLNLLGFALMEARELLREHQ